MESAREMLAAVEAALPADIAIFAAAVADWRVANEGEQKIKKTAAGMPPLQLVENPDILATISKLQRQRPQLVIGFAAETEHLIDNAKQTRTQRLRLDRRQRRVARNRRHGRRPKHRASADARRRRDQGRILPPHDQERGRRELVERIVATMTEIVEVSEPIKVDVLHCLMAEGLPLPGYQSATPPGSICWPRSPKTRR